MKPLQINFTTPEQSKRLLELGVPKDSADCFYQLNYPLGNLLVDTPTIISFNLDVNEIVWDEVYAIPCWSVGRLMEIYHICIPNTSIYGWSYHEDVNGSYIDYIIQEYVDAHKELDFSKLEE